MYFPDFKYHSPQTLEEALSILRQSGNVALIAGGTDLLVEMKKGIRHHHDIVSLSEINDLKLIYEDEDNLCIGAGVTHNEIVLSPIIKKRVKYIAEAASKIGTEQIRNMATIGGNLCTGASCCDMAPILMALNSSVEITGLNENRTVLLKDFFINHRKISINKAEIMRKIIVPLPGINNGVCFEKFGLRESASISVASVAASIDIYNNICEDACVVIGAVAPTPIICYKANEMLKGSNIKDISDNSEVLFQTVESVLKDSLPVEDFRGSVDYRKNLLKVLAQRVIINATARSKNSVNQKNSEK